MKQNDLYCACWDIYGLSPVAQDVKPVCCLSPIFYDEAHATRDRKFHQVFRLSVFVDIDKLIIIAWHDITAGILCLWSNHGIYVYKIWLIIYNKTKWADENNENTNTVLYSLDSDVKNQTSALSELSKIITARRLVNVWTYMVDFQSREVVDHGSETQPQAVEN